jgi:UDP-sulfoquinovose synthase
MGLDVTREADPLRVLILGGDGYLGWPTAMNLAAKGHEVTVLDNYLRRRVAFECDSGPLIEAPDLGQRAAIFDEVTGRSINVIIGDCTDYPTLSRAFLECRPEAVVHYAEQPSGPYSMSGYEAARLTINNNLNSTFNLVWAVLEHAPECHIVKLGTMGEYGTPNIDIEEGWLNVEHNGREDRFLFPRQAGSLYHTTKIFDTDLLWFYVRTYGLRVTDLMQGPVYGVTSDEAELHPQLRPNFHYDDIFGTVINRFLVQAVAGLPLTVYGEGGQTKGYLNLVDTLQCISLVIDNPAETGELRILNQFTETFSINELATKVQQAGRHLDLDVKVESITNPRKEAEQHYYNPAHTGLPDLGLKPRLMTEEVLVGMLELVRQHRDRIRPGIVLPRVRWGS